MLSAEAGVRVVRFEMDSEVTPKDTLLEELRGRVETFFRSNDRDTVYRMLKEVGGVVTATNLRVFVATNYRRKIAQMPSMMGESMARFVE